MSYATTNDVAVYLPVGYTLGVTAGVPSLAAVTEFLSHTANQIDAALASRGLAVPVTSPAWFLTDLLRLNAQGAAALVLLQLAPLIANQVSGTAGQPQQSLAGSLQSRFDKQLADWREKGIGIPVAVSTQENDLAPRGYLTDTGAWGQPDGTVTDAVGNPLSGAASFSREMVF